MDIDTAKNLSRLGYWTLYSGDGKLHILRRNARGAVSRGERALCGCTARRRDYRHEKPSCPDCLRTCMAEVSAQQADAVDAEQVSAMSKQIRRATDP